MESLSAEVDDALQKQWTDDTGMAFRSHIKWASLFLKSQDWHEIVLWKAMLPVTVQQTSRIFLGEEVCRDPAWHHMVVHYTMTVFQAAEFVQFWPQFLRKAVSTLSPACRLLRKQLSEIRSVVVPVYDRRRSHQAARKAQGLGPDQFHDLLGSIEKFANGRPFRPEMLQLRLSLGAIQPSSDMLVKVIFQICERPRLIEELREEARTILGRDGWGKTGMYNLKLMDSVLKESQRLHPLLIGNYFFFFFCDNYPLTLLPGSMTRIATEKVRFSDGLEIPKGTKLMISSHHMWDPEVYPDPNQFDGHRFLNLRQLPGQETSSQLVSTSQVHLGFGHGRFACPGRYLAADLVKMILCHILIKYDLKFGDGNARPQPLGFGHFLVSDPMAKIVIRRREEDMPVAPSMMAQ
jgi:cytochrome P450